MILNRQDAVRVPVSDLDRFLVQACRKLHVAPDALTVCLVSNAQMARWNRAFRKKSGPTDVLSFPVEDGSGTRATGKSRSGRRVRRSVVVGKNGFSFRSFASSDSYLGDIAIAPAVARKNARRFGRIFTDELRILILHGVIHLLGYDHETDQGEMDRLEQSVRRSLRVA
jgi:probable rRNA maturation factor